MLFFLSPLFKKSIESERVFSLPQVMITYFSKVHVTSYNKKNVIKVLKKDANA
jgi:hypothetical protein